MLNKTYKHEPILGKAPDKMLPEGFSLVLEGGGTRGFYSSGVMEAFMDEGLMFPYIIGVSAGAANAITYISGQKLRSRQIVENYVGDKRYVSKRNLLLHRSLFNMDFIFNTVPENFVFFDWDMFYSQDIKFLTGTMDVATGQTVWFGKEHINPACTVTMASCSIPFVSKIVEYQGLRLLDGGVSDPIPIEKSIADGNKFHVIVLTRNEGYAKEAFGHERLMKLVGRRYPAMIDTFNVRHEIYNRQLALCEQLEREGKAIIIRPLKQLQMDRSGSNTKELLKLYDEGHEEGRDAVKHLLNVLSEV